METQQKEIDLLKLCQLWYVTRQTIYGTMIEPGAAEALKAYDTLVQDVIERNGL